MDNFKGKNEKIKIEEIPINKDIKSSNKKIINEGINNYKNGKEEGKKEEEGGNEEEEEYEEEEEEEEDDIEMPEKK